MILGILALVFCGLVTGIPALILGNGAKKEIAMSGAPSPAPGWRRPG